MIEQNRIITNRPGSVGAALKESKGRISNYSMICTSVLRYTAPEWGAPEVKSGEHTPPEAWEVVEKVPIAELQTALRVQKKYLDKIGASSACYSRNQHYLRKFVDFAVEQGWLPNLDKEKAPKLHRFNKPKGERRTYASSLRTTSLKHPKSYVLGTSTADYLIVDSRNVLANEQYDQELRDLQIFGEKFRKPAQVKLQLYFIKAIYAYLHRVKQVPLSELCLDILVPFVQLRFSEKDFAGTEAFAVNSRNQLLDPMRAEQMLSTAESMGLRRARAQANNTIRIVEGFFAWRQQELAEFGQPEGYSPATKREVLGAVILVARYQYRDQTDVEETDNFDDIPVIKRLRKKIQDHPLDIKKTQKQIRKRSISWEKALDVFELQRADAMERTCTSTDQTRKSNTFTRKLQPTTIAANIQKALVLGFMVLIPPDRQQTYRGLEFGTTLKNGTFLDDDCEEFSDWGIPARANQAKFWINLEVFKTVDIYGEFWYPVPNVEFSDGTTFYQLIAAWLWGFWDEEGEWPTYYKGENHHWQGYIDTDGNRCGWRTALQPQHNLMFTMPASKTPYYPNTFTSLVKSIFVRFTQEFGPPIPVTPHSLRHMLALFLELLKISKDEERSFSYVSHHSPEMRQGRYVYRDNMHRIAPAVRRMEQIIRSFL